VPIMPASPVEPFDVPEGWVFIWQWDRHLESRHTLPPGYGLHERVTTVQRNGYPEAAAAIQRRSAVSSRAPWTTQQA
jgi:hypothetical protein